MDQVFGISPSAVQEPNVSSINPAQLALQSLIAAQYSNILPSLAGNILSGRPGLQAPNDFAAPLSTTETGLISDIVGEGTGGAPGQTLGSAQSALTQILSGQPIDYSQYFKDSIATPLENTFSERTLPALKAAFARSAGGGTSTGMNTGYSAAVGHATEDLNQQLQSAASSLGATAETNAAQQRVQGVSMAPNLALSFLQPLTTALGAADMPRQIQQQELTGQTNWALNAIQLLSSLFGGAGNLASQGTVQQGNTVVNPGSPGYLGSLIAGIGSGAGKALA